MNPTFPTVLGFVDVEEISTNKALNTYAINYTNKLFDQVYNHIYNCLHFIFSPKIFKVSKELVLTYKQFFLNTARVTIRLVTGESSTSLQSYCLRFGHWKHGKEDCCVLKGYER